MKMKSLSSLKKRMKRTARGKFVYRPGGTSHNNRCKSRSRKRRLSTPATAGGALERSVKRLVPYL